MQLSFLAAFEASYEPNGEQQRSFLSQATEKGLFFGSVVQIGSFTFWAAIKRSVALSFLLFLKNHLNFFQFGSVKS